MKIERREGRVRLRKACSGENTVEQTSGIDGLTNEDMRIGLLTGHQDPSIEHPAGLIEVNCQPDGAFGQDTHIM
jgi:hypothetical protein